MARGFESLSGRAAAIVAAVALLIPQMGAAQAPAPGGSTADAPTLSPATLAILAPARDAIVKAKVRAASLTPAANDRQALLRLRDIDQTAWLAVSHTDFSGIPLEEKAAARAYIGDQLEPLDEADVQALLGMLPPEGWFATSRYGEDGEDAAYLIIMHGDIDLWRRFAPVIGRFAAAGEARGSHYALMSDRLAVHEGQPQAYGSQVACVDGVYKPYPIEDPEHIDERRLKLGMPAYGDYLKTFEGLRC